MKPAGSVAAALVWLLAMLSGCSPMDINVGTKDPLRVDLNLDVHVYQHGPKEKTEDDEETGDSASAADESGDPRSFEEVVKSRRDRQEEIQTLKNNRLVGEARNGLLDIRNIPGGDWGAYVVDTVEAENRDREFIYRVESEKKNVPEEQIRRQLWQQWQRRSFPGEWIEVESSSGGYEWIQKKGAPTEPDSEEDADAKPDE